MGLIRGKAANRDGRELRWVQISRRISPDATGRDFPLSQGMGFEVTRNNTGDPGAAKNFARAGVLSVVTREPEGRNERP